MSFLMLFVSKSVWVVCLKLSSFSFQREILLRGVCVLLLVCFFPQGGGICAYIFWGVRNTGVCSFICIVLSAQ